MPIVEVNPKSARLKAGESITLEVKFFDNGGNHIGPERPQEIKPTIKSGDGHIGSPVIINNVARFSFMPISDKSLLEIGGNGVVDPPIIEVEMEKGLKVMPNSIYQNSTNVFINTAITEVEYTKETFENPVTRREIEGVWYYKADLDDKMIKSEEEISKIIFSDTEWKNCKIPFNYSLEDPQLTDFYGWVFFRKRVKIDANFLNRHKRFILRFYGVDYFARVWFNEKFLGSHEGYFNPFEFDITDLIKEGDNILLLLVKNPYDRGIETAAAENATNLAEKVWIKGILNYHDTRPGSIMLDDRAAQTIGTGGIVDRVEIIGQQNIRFENVRIDTVNISDNRATLRLTVDIGYYEEGTRDLLLTTEIEGSHKTINKDENGIDKKDEVKHNIHFRHRITVEKGFSRFIIEREIENPFLWFPYSHPELGDPDLYNIRIFISDTIVEEREIEAARPARSRCSKKTKTEKKIIKSRTHYDLFETTFGFREARLIATDNRTEFFINNKRIFVRGTNIIPSIYFSKIDAFSIERDISLIKKANLDAVVVLDHLPPDLFYKKMDEAGILVFQEFTLVWEYNIADFRRECGDPDLTSNIEVIKRMVAEALIKYQNHPSIVWWSMHDEPFFTFGNFDAGETVIPKEIFEEHERPPFMIDRSGNRILDEEIRKVVEAYSPSVPYHISGNEYTNSTNYYGWYNGTIMDLFEKKVEPMPIEFGAQAAQFSSEKNIFKRYEELFWPPKNDEAYKKLAFHCCQLPLMSARIGRTSRYENYLEWIFATQLYQSFILKTHIEFFRLHKYNPTGTIFYFMFNNYWEGITWATLSANREPTIAYQRLCEYNRSIQPIALTKNGIFTNDTAIIPLFVVNDEQREHDQLRLLCELKRSRDTFVLRSDPDGFNEGIRDQFMRYEHRETLLAIHPLDQGKETIRKWEFDISVMPDSVNRISDIELTSSEFGRPANLILYLTLLKGDEIISKNKYPVLFADEEYLRTLPVGLSPKPEFNIEISVNYTKPTNVPVKFSLERVYSLRPGYGAILFGDDKKILKNLEPGLYKLRYTHMNTERVTELIPISDMKIELII